MRRIYSECQFGLLYLGKEEDGSDCVPQFLQKLVTSLGRLRREQNPIPSFSISNDPYLPAADDEGWKSLAALYKRPWFRRIWIIQEFSLPPEIRMICGRWEIPGAYLAALSVIPVWRYSRVALEALVDETGGVAESLDMQELHIRVRIHLGRKLGDASLDEPLGRLPVDFSLSLVWLLFSCQLCEATDPRDHFFALLGLASDVTNSSVIADYTKSLKDVEMDFAKYLVDSGWGLSLLYGARNTPGLPSWLPDFKGGAFATPSGEIESIVLKKQPASNIRLGWDSGILIVSGCRIDVVKILSMSSARGSGGLHGWIQEVDAIVTSTPSYPTGQSIEQAVWRTIVADRSVDGKRPAPQEYHDQYKFARDTADLKQHFHSLGPLWEAGESMDELFRFRAAVRQDCRFCITEAGFFAMVPNETRLDDAIFVIEGDPQRSTFIVREDSESGDSEVGYHTWIGHAYVHDLWKARVYEETSWEDLILR
jgi:hypothetical protein